MNKFVSEETLVALKHEVLQSIISPGDNTSRHGVNHIDPNEILLGEAPSDVPLLLTSPLELDNGNKLYGYIVKKSVPDIRGNYLKYTTDILNGLEPEKIEHVISLFGLSVPPSIVGAKECYELFALKENHKEATVITLGESTVDNEKVFEGVNLAEEEDEIVDDNFHYIDPDYAEFLLNFNPHASTLVPIMEEVGRPITPTNVNYLADLEMNCIGYLENSDKVATGYTTLDGAESAEGVILKTGSVLYKISYEAALALSHDDIEQHVVLDHYFLTPLAWYVPVNDPTAEPVEISFKVFGVSDIENLYTADFDLNYQTTQISGEHRPLETLGITPKEVVVEEEVEDEVLKDKDDEPKEPVDPQKVTYGLGDIAD